jgi:hypothetical protein
MTKHPSHSFVGWFDCAKMLKISRRSSNKLCVRWAAVSSIAVVFLFFVFVTSSGERSNKESLSKDEEFDSDGRHQSKRSQRSSSLTAYDYNLMESSPHIPPLKECTIGTLLIESI